MPKSKKRVKKPQDEIVPVTRNIVKRPIGRIIVVILALSFILAGFVGLIYTLVQVMTQ
jgi:type III secretory pathway component EscS